MKPVYPQIISVIVLLTFHFCHVNSNISSGATEIDSRTTKTAITESGLNSDVKINQTAVPGPTQNLKMPIHGCLVAIDVGESTKNDQRIKFERPAVIPNERGLNTKKDSTTKELSSMNTTIVPTTIVRKTTKKGPNTTIDSITEPSKNANSDTMRRRTTIDRNSLTTKFHGASVTGLTTNVYRTTTSRGSRTTIEKRTTKIGLTTDITEQTTAQSSQITTAVLQTKIYTTTTTEDFDDKITDRMTETGLTTNTIETTGYPIETTNSVIDLDEATTSDDQTTEIIETTGIDSMENRTSTREKDMVFGGTVLKISQNKE